MKCRLSEALAPAFDQINKSACSFLSFDAPYAPALPSGSSWHNIYNSQ
jgi:hypothetical protein